MQLLLFVLPVWVLCQFVIFFSHFSILVLHFTPASLPLIHFAAALVWTSENPKSKICARGQTAPRHFSRRTPSSSLSISPLSFSPHSHQQQQSTKIFTESWEGGCREHEERRRRRKKGQRERKIKEIDVRVQLLDIKGANQLSLL